MKIRLLPVFLALFGFFQLQAQYPAYPIGIVSTTDAMGLPDSVNVQCAVSGIVHGIDMQGGGNVSFTIIDANNDGIGVFGLSSSAAGNYVVQEGDEVLVRGSIGHFNGLLQMGADSVEVISTGNHIQIPAMVSNLDETTESQLVMFQNVTLVDPAQWIGSGSFNVDFTNGFNTFTMRLDSDVDLASMPAPAGAFDIIGIGGQFDNSAPHDEGYQLFPRYATDLTPAGFVPNLVISEIMYNPPEAGTDTLEYVEIINNGTEDVNLSNMILAGADHVFAPAVLPAGGILVVSERASAMTAVFGVASTQWTAGGLSNSGEFVTIKDQFGMMIDSVNYDDAAPWPTSPDGMGNSLAICDLESDNNDGNNWQASINATGININGIDVFASPGVPNNCSNDPLIGFLGSSVTVNEDVGSVELMVSIASGNANNTMVDVVLSAASTATSMVDFDYVPIALNFPAGVSIDTISIPINIIDDADIEPTETLILELMNAGNNAIITNGTYTVNINDNDSPIEPIVITELYYNDPSGPDTLEFLELYNNGTMAVDLDGYAIIQGISHTFSSTVINPGEYYLLVKDAAAFQNAFGIVADEWGTGGLNNTGEPVELVNASGQQVDMVTFDDGGDWPSAADGNGPSLELCDVNANNDDPANWDVSTNGTGVVIAGIEIMATPGATNTATCGGTTNPTMPVYPIGTVTTSDGNGVVDSLGVTCGLQGVVYGVDLQGGPGLVSFTLIDGNNDGIAIFANNPPAGDYNVNETDEVIVFGTIANFNGLIQLTADSIAVLSTNNTLVNPTVVTALDESTESQLVRIENVSLVDPGQWNTSGGSFNVDLTDGSNTYSLRIDNDVDIAGMPAPTGTFNVTGLGGQFDNSVPHDEGYQILPRYMPDIDPYNAGTITFPNYPIATVTTNDANGEPDSLNVTCTLNGIVYGVNLQESGGGIQFTIIDGAGDGIGVFNFNETFGYSVQEGDEVNVQGTIDHFNGLAQIVADSIWEVSQNNPLVTPPVVTALNEATESQLVKIENVTIVDPGQWTGSGSFNVDVTDGTNTSTMRIDNDVDLASQSAPAFPFNLTGLGGQFDNSIPHDEGYQILPRYTGDIELIISAKEVNLENHIQISPNPVSDNLYINSDIEINQIKVINTLGQEVKMINASNQAFEIEVNSLAKGLYYISFNTKEGQWTTVFVKQ